MMSSSQLNLKTILYDYAIPGVVAVGVGLFAYALTGGELEYPPTSQESVRQQGGIHGELEDGEQEGGFGDDDQMMPASSSLLMNEEFTEKLMSQVETQLALYADRTSDQVMLKWKEHYESNTEAPMWAKEVSYIAD